MPASLLYNGWCRAFVSLENSMFLSTCMLFCCHNSRISCGIWVTVPRAELMLITYAFFPCMYQGIFRAHCVPNKYQMFHFGIKCFILRSGQLKIYLRHISKKMQLTLLIWHNWLRYDRWMFDQTSMLKLINDKDYVDLKLLVVISFVCIIYVGSRIVYANAIYIDIHHSKSHSIVNVNWLNDKYTF